MMKTIATIAALCALLVGSPAITQAAERAESRVQSEPTTKALERAGSVRSSKAHSVKLDPPSPDQVRAEIGEPSKGAPLKVGFGRDVPGLGAEAASAAALEWEELADGARVAALRLTSPSAASVRAAIRVGNLPAGSVLRFQAPGDELVFEIPAADVNAILAGNLATGEHGADARLYWSPLIEGDTILAEIEIPASANPREVHIAFPQLSHLVTSAARDFVVDTKASAACEIDAMCSAATWGSQINAVARMVFSSGGSTYLCSGTLLADLDSTSVTPYFLSANHCIGSQALASTLTTYWFYRSTSCNSGTLGAYRQLASGATLLYNSTTTDTSFMRLNATPPAGAVYAGWFVGATPASGTGVTGLHHPRGDWLKISGGRIGGYVSCSAPSNGSFSCNDSSAASSTFYQVLWSSGLMEPGSSGSGLFRNDGLLIGQLYGGNSDCTGGGDDIYGRFDVAYNAALKTFLSGTSLTVTKSGSGAGTVTSTPAGIDCGSTCSAGFTPGAAVALTATPATRSVFMGWSGVCNGTGACVVTMDSAKTVNAIFDVGTATLTVSTTGAGTVTSTPAGITCPGVCSAAFPVGTSVALSASPARDSAFQGWSGACSGAGACTVNVNTAATVAAAFGSKSQATLALSSTANPAAAGQQVTLRATASGVAGTPTGVVSFTADGAQLCSLVPLAAGVASCSTAALSVGNHVIVASYSGDAAYNAATSSPFTQGVVTATSTTANALFNLSTRAQVRTGNDVMIAGFIIGGSTPKTVAITVAGPSLASAGITNPLADPTLTLVRSADNLVIATNDNWQAASNVAQIQASGFAPANALEPAILMTLAPGAYTAIVSGVNGGTGVGLVGVFEVDHPETPLVNLSARAQVMTGNDVMIGGFVIQGSAPQKVVVRARGPSLVSLGIANALANPALTLVRSADNAVVATNDNWQSQSITDASALQASGFAPANALEPAIIATLAPGAYTAIVTGVGGVTGVGTIEVFTAP